MERAEVQRRKTHCPNCKEHFAFGYPLALGEKQPDFVTMKCPFCGSKLKVDLSPHKTGKIEVYKGANTPATPHTALTLPDELYAEFNQGNKDD